MGSSIRDGNSDVELGTRQVVVDVGWPAEGLVDGKQVGARLKEGLQVVGVVVIETVVYLSLGLVEEHQVQIAPQELVVGLYGDDGITIDVEG